jgi:hypothetical protein
MKRLQSMWNAVMMGRKDEILSIGLLAIMSFLTVLGAFIARGLHHDSLGDFFGGAAVSFSGILVLLLFQLRSAEFRNDPDESKLTELRLSR